MKTKLLVIFLLYVTVIFSQTEVTFDTLVNNPSIYIFGLGTGKTIDEADENALQDLNEAISVTIKSSFTSQIEELKNNNGNGDVVTSKEYASRVIETTANNFIKNTERFFKTHDAEGNNYEICRWITRENKNSIFNSRCERAKAYKNRADENLDMEILNVNMALIDYYSGLLLINSHPDRDTIKVQQGPVGKNLKLLLERKLENTLMAVTIRSLSEQEMENFYRIGLQATYKGKKIGSLYFKYFDGSDMIKGNISDGMGTIEIDKTYYEQCEHFTLEIYFGKGKYDKAQLIELELQALEEFLYTDDFPNTKKIYKPTQQMQQFVVETEEINEIALEFPVNIDRKKNIDFILQEVVEAIRNKNYRGVKNYFSETGFTQFQKIMNYGEVSVCVDDYKIRLVEMENRIQVRSIPVSINLREPGNNKIFTEKLCFLFEDNKICWINFALEDYYIDDAIRRNEHSHDFLKRLSGINFMEYYKTIFNLKQVDLISEIFADSAQIFVGYIKESKEVNKNLARELDTALESHQVHLEKYSKSEYIDRLRDHVFPKNKYINIQFQDMDLLRRSEQRPIYAVSLHQEYFSSTYSDQGYLMLLLDFANENEPKIFFRYWQPEKFGEEDLRAIEPGDFNL